jgi:hypothetical protein
MSEEACGILSGDAVKGGAERRQEKFGIYSGRLWPPA